MFKPPARLNQEELLDDVGHDPGLLRASMEQVAAVDRWLGGRRGVRRIVRRVLDQTDRSTLRMLDVGTGNGRVLAETADWIRSRGLAVTAVGIDMHPQIVPLAGERRQIHAIRGDGCRMPFATDAFDVATTILTLHHFDDDSAVALLREMARVTRSRVIVSDLERSHLHFWGARLLAETIWRSNSLTRNDGPISVMRSFTRTELGELATKAGLSEVRVRRIHPFRLVMEGRP